MSDEFDIGKNVQALRMSDEEWVLCEKRIKKHLVFWFETALEPEPTPEQN